MIYQEHKQIPVNSRILLFGDRHTYVIDPQRQVATSGVNKGQGRPSVYELLSDGYEHPLGFSNGEVPKIYFSQGYRTARIETGGYRTALRSQAPFSMQEVGAEVPKQELIEMAAGHLYRPRPAVYSFKPRR